MAKAYRDARGEKERPRYGWIIAAKICLTLIGIVLGAVVAYFGTATMWDFWGRWGDDPGTVLILLFHVAVGAALGGRLFCYPPITKNAFLIQTGVLVVLGSGAAVGYGFLPGGGRHPNILGMVLSLVIPLYMLSAISFLIGYATARWEVRRKAAESKSEQ